MKGMRVGRGAHPDTCGGVGQGDDPSYNLCVTIGKGGTDPSHAVFPKRTHSSIWVSC
jgi:hypothetical protein